MDDPSGQSEERLHNGRHIPADSQIETLTLIIAHLAAQLTMTQIRLRGLATVLEQQGVVEPKIVRGNIVEISDKEAGFYLRENLGEHLSELIEVDELARQIVEFLGSSE